MSSWQKFGEGGGLKYLESDVAIWSDAFKYSASFASCWMFCTIYWTIKTPKIAPLASKNQWRWSVEREIKICSPQSYQIPLFSITFDHDWIFPGLFCWWAFSRTRPMKIHLRVFWFFPLKKHLSRQGRIWTWCQFPGKLDSNFFTLL